MNFPRSDMILLCITFILLIMLFVLPLMMTKVSNVNASRLSGRIEYVIDSAQDLSDFGQNLMLKETVENINNGCLDKPQIDCMFGSDVSAIGMILEAKSKQMLDTLNQVLRELKG